MPKDNREPALFLFLTFLRTHRPVSLPQNNLELERFLRDADLRNPDHGIWLRVFVYIFKELPNESRDAFGYLAVGENNLRVKRDERWDLLFSASGYNGYQNFRTALRIYRFYQRKTERVASKQAT